MLPNFAQLCHQHVAKKLSACCHKYNYNVVANTSACCHLEVDISHISSAQLLAERRDLQDIIVKIVVVKFSIGTDIIISSSQNYEKYHDQNRVLMPPTTCCQECDLFNRQESDKNLGILPSSYSGHHHDHHHSFHRPVKQYRRYTCLAAQQGVWSLPSARQWNISVSQGAQIIRSLREALATWRGSQNLKNDTQSYNMENGWYRLSFKYGLWAVGHLGHMGQTQTSTNLSTQLAWVTLFLTQQDLMLGNSGGDSGSLGFVLFSPSRWVTTCGGPNWSFCHISENSKHCDRDVWLGGVLPFPCKFLYISKHFKTFQNIVRGGLVFYLLRVSF